MCVKEHKSLLDIVLENVLYGIITNGEAALTPLGTIYLEYPFHLFLHCQASDSLFFLQLPLITSPILRSGRRQQDKELSDRGGVMYVLCLVAFQVLMMCLFAIAFS